VARPPADKPLMLFDGDCSFCRRAAFFLRGWCHSQVDFASFHRAYGHFPEIGLAYFREEVKLITPSGHVYGGAEAVFKALTYGSHLWDWLFWLYLKLPPFRWVSEAIYRHIARNRAKYSKRVGPFWEEWESGGEKYETFPPKRENHRDVATPNLMRGSEDLRDRL